MFMDAESGLSHYMWGVGSSRGHDDVIAFMYTEQECIETGPTAIDVLEGHAYYVSVKVCYSCIYNLFCLYQLHV